MLIILTHKANITVGAYLNCAGVVYVNQENKCLDAEHH